MGFSVSVYTCVWCVSVIFTPILLSLFPTGSFCSLVLSLLFVCLLVTVSLLRAACRSAGGSLFAEHGQLIATLLWKIRLLPHQLSTACES